MTKTQRTASPQPEMIGLVPAAGRATRVAPLPCSKELFPVGFYTPCASAGPRPKPACLYLLEQMRLAGARRAFVVLREGKWDIPAYLGDGSRLDMRLAYLTTGDNGGPAYTLDRAYPFLRDANVLFGFPDVILQPLDAFAALASRLTEGPAQVALAAFAAHDPANLDMLDIADGGRVRSIEIKPKASALRHTWMAAAWSPAFTRFLHGYVGESHDDSDEQSGERGRPELTVGHVLRAAVNEGLRVEAVVFGGGSYIDIGTPQGLASAVRAFA